MKKTLDEDGKVSMLVSVGALGQEAENLLSSFTFGEGEDESQ